VAHRAGSVVFEMVYDPLETRLLREARAAGCTTVDGLEMLVAQAAVQFETWTGLAAPLEEMRQTALLVARKRAGQTP
jgi:shikimate dehydrogenase